MIAVVICLTFSIILLFISMVLSSISASSAQSIKPQTTDSANAHKYSMASALVCGLSVIVLIVVMVIYIYGNQPGSSKTTELHSL